jgi:hypothetical protein
MTASISLRIYTPLPGNVMNYNTGCGFLQHNSKRLADDLTYGLSYLSLILTDNSSFLSGFVLDSDFDYFSFNQ